MGHFVIKAGANFQKNWANNSQVVSKYLGITCLFKKSQENQVLVQKWSHRDNVKLVTRTHRRKSHFHRLLEKNVQSDQWYCYDYFNVLILPLQGDSELQTEKFNVVHSITDHFRLFSFRVLAKYSVLCLVIYSWKICIEENMNILWNWGSRSVLNYYIFLRPVICLFFCDKVYWDKIFNSQSFPFPSVLILYIKVSERQIDCSIRCTFQELLNLTLRIKYMTSGNLQWLQ